MKERLQKILAHWGVASRRACEQLIVDGHVSVNGLRIHELGFKADPNTDMIQVDGRRLARIPPKKVVIALYKPVGYLSTSKSTKGKRPIVLDLVPNGMRLYPVGRLDLDSSGLLLLTNDGEFAHRIMHPRFGYDKEYFVRVHDALSATQFERLREGVSVNGRFVKPLALHRMNATSFKIVLGEGRKREIREMTRAVGGDVMELCRIRIGSLRLGRMHPGTWRELSEKEIEKLLNYRREFA
jgi:23S rRNA pseudouridine2605 synthase